MRTSACRALKRSTKLSETNAMRKKIEKPVNEGRRNLLMGFGRRVQAAGEGLGLKRTGGDAGTSAQPAPLRDRIAECVRAGDHAGAAEAYREWLREHPEDTATRLRLGVSLYRAGQYVQAGAELKRVLATGPSNTASLYAGLAQARLGKREQALAYLKQYFNPDEQALMRELNVQTGLLEMDPDADLSFAVTEIEATLAERRRELASD